MKYVHAHPSYLTRGLCIFAASSLVIFCGLYFFNVDARNNADVSTEQNLVLGRLAYSTLTGTFGGPQAGISTANADGTGIVNVTNFPPVDDPSWSPDGRIVHVQFGNGSEIFVMNADGTNKTNLSNTPGISEANPSWSTTGKIVYERDSQIWTMNVDGTGQAAFTAITQPTPTGPAWSADGSKLAFVSGGEVWKINADGTGEQRVTINASLDTDPAWSPDGSKILFGTNGSGIAVVNADGTNQANLTTVAGDARPAWSPDGTTIAFRRSTAPAGIYVMDATGGNQVRIIADQQTSASIFFTSDDPAWQPTAPPPNTFSISGRVTRFNVGLQGVTVNLSGSTNSTATTDAIGNYQFSGLAPGGSYTVSPSMLNHYFTPPNRKFNGIDGNKIADFAGSGICTGPICALNGQIAFVRNGNEIYSMNPDGTNPTNLTNDPATDVTPTYSPDGTKIAFVTNRDGNNEIYQMNSNGGSPIRLTTDPASDTAPDYSPNGASIIFISNRDGNNEIYRMDANGLNPVRITNDAANQNHPSYSPDGQKIVYMVSAPMTATKLYSMNADGSNQQPFPDDGALSNYYNRPSYSPDGSKIIFVFGNDITTQNIWTMNADGSNRAMAQFGRSSPTYSPDGTKVAHNCCFAPNQNSNGIWVSNVGGPLGIQLTGAQFDDFPAWQPIRTQRRTHFDFDGDRRSDISLFRPSNSAWYIIRSTEGLWVPVWGLSTDVTVPADYDGDLKTDVAVWRASDENFYVLNSFDGTVRIENFGLPGDLPVAGDFDGDSKADVAVYRGGTQGVFYYRGSMGNPQRNITSIPWGVSGDKPVVSDYDGDGRTDAAIYRPSNGTWYARKSSDGQLFAVNFGISTDVVVPADYDSDGKADLTAYRDGTWYIMRSTLGFTAFQFGIAGDIPAPADYDGDGRADATVYRNGVWWILRSQSGTAEAIGFGASGDRPVPSAFVR